jgi:Fe-S cluster assembly ATPase SufC
MKILRLAYNSKQKFYNKPEVDPIEFLTIYEKLELVNTPLFLSRNVNEGFSVVKKRNEILQMILLSYLY